MRLLLSIKPAFAEQIFEGDKRYEFRRAIFKRDVSRALVYASAPVSKVVGEFVIEDVISLELDQLWRRTRKHAGITQGYFYAYFAGLKSGYAIEVGAPARYRRPLSLEVTFGLRPPQSFAYV